MEVAARAGGRIVHTSLNGWVAVATQQEALTNKEPFVSKVYAAGAMFVASSIVATACLRLTGTFGV